MTARPDRRLAPVEVRTLPAAPRLVPPRPTTMTAAVALMAVGAVVSAAEGVATHQLTDHVDTRRRLADRGLTGDLDRLADVSLVLALALGLVAAAIWIVHAVACARGHRWARTSGTVLGVLFVLASLVALAGAGSGSGATVAHQLLRIGVAGGTVVLLWLPSSTAFFRDTSART
ncbi:hypothetical protein HC251_20415 [Iamia sp. SCSIO 61187]|uniref:hypothetical protein n=1 Tax=Iamia sp. SCSIO 61187 TaxID=2722752 RepID=UPI001C639919|nr:hypothetical protein [Iamia sp. SCSIO 61187]QYG94562.1 hypothetical protein HC251_20415 [Iamia sp. SCSIO 61187]